MTGWSRAQSDGFINMKEYEGSETEGGRRGVICVFAGWVDWTCMDKGEEESHGTPIIFSHQKKMDGMGVTYMRVGLFDLCAVGVRGD